MTVHYADDLVTLHHGDCLDVLRALPAQHVDAIVTDPPYGLGFMGRTWDELPPGETWARECLRVLKPGGYLLAFGGSRTWHRLAVAVEDAGFELRDSIAWLYGNGFPKSLDVARAVDRHMVRDPARDLAEEYRCTAWMRSTGVTARQIDDATGTNMGGHYLTDKSQPAVPTARLLDLIRPLLPPIPDWLEDLVEQREQDKADSRARNEGKPFLDALRADPSREYSDHDSELAQQWKGYGTALKPAFEPIVVARKALIGTVAANVLSHGTGALNIDACRVGGAGGTRKPPSGEGCRTDSVGGYLNATAGELVDGLGRWPSNVAFDDSQADELDRQSGTLTSGATPTETSPARPSARPPADSGGASRFFPTFRYEPKAPAHEKPRVDDYTHETVKPLDLMRWLVRLVTPGGGSRA